jgi:hypothetical protein
LRLLFLRSFAAVKPGECHSQRKFDFQNEPNFKLRRGRRGAVGLPVGKQTREDAQRAMSILLYRFVSATIDSRFSKWLETY